MNFRATLSDFQPDGETVFDTYRYKLQDYYVSISVENIKYTLYCIEVYRITVQPVHRLAAFSYFSLSHANNEFHTI